MLNTVLVTIHALACVALILIVLLQTGKGAQMGAAFGGSSQTLFGSTGQATFMNKLTTAAAIVFMLTCLMLTMRLGKNETHSIMENTNVNEMQAPPPAMPEAKPVDSRNPEQQPMGSGVAPAQKGSPAPAANK